MYPSNIRRRGLRVACATLLACFAATRLFAVFSAVLALSSKSDALTLTKENFAAAIAEKPTLVKFYANWCGFCQKLEPMYDELAKKYKDDPRVNIAQVDAETQKELATAHGINAFPIIKWYNKDQPLKGIQYNSANELGSLESFVNEKLAELATMTPNNTPRVRRSEPVAPREPLVTLGDSNFTKYVMDAGKNVFVKFYAPWCGHCKNMANDYTLLAEAFKNDDHITIAKIDSTVHTKFPVQGYPTLKFFPAGSDIKTGIDYSGGRKLKEMVDFINANANAYRAEDGSLLPEAGLLPELRPFIKGFYAAPDKIDYLQSGMASEVVAKAQKKPSFKHYLQTGEFILKRGVGFVSKEIARLEKVMADKKSVDQKKLDEMQMRHNILKEFKAAEGKSDGGDEL